MTPDIITQNLLVDATSFPESFHDPDQIKYFITGLAEGIGVYIETWVQHEFEPQGLTVGAIISESHIIVHTWPEHKFVQVDISSCKEFDPEDVIRFMKEEGFNEGYYTLLYRGPEPPIRDFVCSFEDVT